MEIVQTTNFQIIARRKLWFMMSTLVIVPGIIFLMLGGLKLGIDFKGGSLMELIFNKPPEISQVKEVLQTSLPDKFSDVQITSLKDNEGNTIVSIRSKPVDNKQQVQIFEALEKKLGKFTQLRVEVVGPTIGEELKRNALYAIVLVMGLIVLYISIRFSFDYAVCVILALLHDTVAVIGMFAFMGYMWGIEVNSLFVTAILTVAGFSVNDTIVTFDRIRENFRLIAKGRTFSQIANASVNQTLTRSLNTSLTTSLPLLIIFIFGGDSIRDFTLALLLGVIVGTYSSICIASPLLVIWRQLAGKDVPRKNRSKATA